MGLFEFLEFAGESLVKFEKEAHLALRRRVEEGVVNGRIFDYREYYFIFYFFILFS